MKLEGLSFEYLIRHENIDLTLLNACYCDQMDMGISFLGWVLITMTQLSAVLSVGRTPGVPFSHPYEISVDSL